ncbi:MAG: site-specific integrase [Methanobrevibacter sp.]|nr:site-specific integrase [Methanobrevibacter sp.]
MNTEDKKILEDLTQTRNIAKNTQLNYIQTIKNYTESQGLTLKQLLDEAENEEDEGIRLKNRTLKKRLITFRNYMLNEKGFSKSTLEKQIGVIKTIYYHYEIDIPKLPKFNERQIREYDPIYYDDLPTKELIQEAIKLSSPLMKAIILFIVSSGCAKAETLSFTIQDFITATKDYHNSTDIYDVIDELKGKNNVVPIFKLRRRKMNKYYYTFCSPEAVDAIIYYLESRTDKLTNDKKLFKIESSYFNTTFSELNRQLGGHKKGAYGIIRSHMLRKFHASNLALGENRLTHEEIDSLQGRTKKKVHESYFFDDPNELRKKYIANMDKVLIFSETVTIDSPEVAAIKKRNDELENNIDRIVEEKLRGKLEEILRDSGYFG